MPQTTLELPADPAEALTAIREASQNQPVLIFKKSPICPVSTRAEDDVSAWLEAHVERDLTVAWIDVIAERALARGLTAELDVRHESPQALWFKAGDLVWHDSHGNVTGDQLSTLASE